RQDRTPVFDKLLISCTHRTYVSIEIVKTDLVDNSTFLATGATPTELVDAGIPREADDGNSVVPTSKNVRPFFPKPIHGFIAALAFANVCLSVHHRKVIAVVVLPCDRVVPEILSGSARFPIGRDTMLVCDVVIISHD